MTDVIGQKARERIAHFSIDAAGAATGAPTKTPGVGRAPASAALSGLASLTAKTSPFEGKARGQCTASDGVLNRPTKTDARPERSPATPLRKAAAP
jgi:hypothetical protein